ncbi:MAG TPA: sigma-54 dependent transcriptional regulator [Povalibacter sp.]|uniref:sigma-54 interaction domain-containing protein n=1 Tax=Povalibacter sp. TaxID=1962978 RepID=UPI002C40D1BD|nr:sigma-54 dependent transcriptional regulator [Povalibacter sp.]HMN46115.1 sigma-54 dependent transcriptional regulator [Povalibacter sp.]
MTHRNGRVIEHPEAGQGNESIRAKAVIFNDPRSQAVLQQIDRVARADAPVLIIGETGTGKELVARHLHAQSGRSGPFVAVNCGAVIQSLAESELFGHQAGSFTGANDTRAGWFEAANGGTLFLDEIGDLSPSLQVKLLRVLQEREVVRVGSRKPIAIDVRLVAATNVDLAEAVANGRFRLDLFYRLNVVTLDLPPLRERPGDILPLVEHFLALYARRLNVDAATLSPDAIRTLQQYSWPGNIRELENVIHAALLLASNGEIRTRDLRFSTLATGSGDAGTAPLDVITAQLQRLFSDPPTHLHQQLEELTVRRAFAYCGNNQVQTARLLGISRNVLRTLLKRFGLIAAEADPSGFDELDSLDDDESVPAMN